MTDTGSATVNAPQIAARRLVADLVTLSARMFGLLQGSGVDPGDNITNQYDLVTDHAMTWLAGEQPT